MTFGSHITVDSFFSGLKASVMAIVFAAVIKIGKKSLKNSFHLFIAILSFIAIFFFRIPFPVMILSPADLLNSYIKTYIHAENPQEEIEEME